MELFESFLQKLKQAIAIKSISTDPAFLPEIKKMVEWLDNELSKIGFNVRTFNEYGNPIILAYLEADPNYKTVVHYGHYDVQPAEVEEGWDSDPFELIEDKNKLYARGSVDNKGQFLIYITAIEKLIKENKLGYNVIFIIEGNEETGSKYLSEFFKENIDSLKCDFVLASDGEILNNQPTIDTTYRGVVNGTLTIFGPSIDLHSGLYGGVVINPIHVLNEVLAKLSDSAGITHILPEKHKPNAKDEEYLKNNKFDKSEFKQNTGFDSPIQDSSYEMYKSLGFANVINVTGITGGYQKEGYRNSIASKASAKINVRFNPGLDPKDVAKTISEYLKKTIPDNIKYEFEAEDLSNGAILDSDNEYIEKASNILKEVHNKEVFFNYCGATLPIASEFNSKLKVPIILTGFGNADCHMHGPNENYDRDLAEKALEFVYKFLHK